MQWPRAMRAPRHAERRAASQRVADEETAVRHQPRGRPQDQATGAGWGRAQEVTQWLLRGATTAQAAQRLAISPHTVNEHVKAIYDKTGARTRGELSATVFFGEHLPRIQSHVAVGDDASFIDAPRPRT